MTQTEALKLALEQRITDYLSAGGLFNPELADHVAVRDLLIDCHKALAEQPAQQEPVAWATQLNEYAHIKWGAKRPEYPMVYEFPLYTTPPQRKPLTHEQRFDLLTKFEPHKNKWEAPAILIDMVEAAHEIKQ